MKSIQSRRVIVSDRAQNIPRGAALITIYNGIKLALNVPSPYWISKGDNPFYTDHILPIVHDHIASSPMP